MKGLFVDSVVKAYGNNKILTDVFLSCNTGETIGLIGRNGCGKSTLLKIIFGVEAAENKFIKANGKRIKSITDTRGLISYLPQQNFLPNGVKLKTIINLFLNKRFSDKLKNNEFILPLLNRSNKQLSGGQRRIIEILLIIHSDSKYILLDEPFNGISPVLKEYVIECINLVKPEKGIIITDHDYNNVLTVSDSIIFLKDGYLRTVKDKKDLIELGYLSVF